MLKTLSISAAIVSGILLTSCNDHESPTASRTITPQWTLAVTPISVEGANGCVSANAASNPPVAILIGAKSVEITLYPDSCNIADCSLFQGPLSGNSFTASMDISFPSATCGEEQGTAVLTGSVSADHRQLTATEVDTYVDASGHQAVFQYSWTATHT